MVYSNLLCDYDWNQIQDPENLPEFHHFKVQGKPGTGTLFGINTLRNRTKLIMKSNLYDTVTAPLVVLFH